MRALKRFSNFRQRKFLRKFSAPVTKFLKDYQPPPFVVETCDLDFFFDEHHCVVTNSSSVKTKNGQKISNLVLDGDNDFMNILSISINGETVSDYKADNTTLNIALNESLREENQEFDLEIVTSVRPDDNKQLEGLYLSNGKYVTQCEPEGFRKFTYFTDRPDVTTKFSTSINASTSFPVLLSNGNLVDYGSNEDRCWAKWEDPYKKPSYLFALVAGDLDSIEDTFSTKDGKEVMLRMYTESHNIQKCQFAMGALKRAMKWDEDRFDLCYDLNIYNVVVVDDFNMGAMENRSLNIFNSKLLLADPETQTDEEMKRIEGVVGHEYFHNWTGNRVTLRDWFQLSLKEGLTVFRDQEFSEDMDGSGVQRIDDVKCLQARQFPEDSGPLSHPVRPDSYIEMNNFYTATVYEKGAEVVRMLQTILGKEQFTKGVQLYLEKHDGQSCTVEDFVGTMEEVSGLDLSQFYLWYSQSGTPVVQTETSFNFDSKQFELKLIQSCGNTPGQSDKKPFMLPVSVALFDKDSGEQLPLVRNGNTNAEETLVLTNSEETFTFNEIEKPPIVSLNRNFTSPIYLQHPQSIEEMAFLMIHDTDAFNRYHHCVKLMYVHIISKYLVSQDEDSEGVSPPIDGAVLEAFKTVLHSTTESSEMLLLSRMLATPDHRYLFPLLAEQNPNGTADPVLLQDCISWFVNSIGSALHLEFEDKYGFCRDQLAERSQDRTLKEDPVLQWRRDSRYRSLINALLPYLMSETKNREQHIHNSAKLIQEQLNLRRNMTEVFGALSVLVNCDRCEDLRSEFLLDFYERHQNDPLVVQKWLRLQATSTHRNVIDHVECLLKHESYDSSNPNFIYSLVGAFAFSNPGGFHHPSGRGYELVTEQIISFDKYNPSVAARLMDCFESWRKIPLDRQEKVQQNLTKILNSNPSKGVFEKVSKCLVKTEQSSSYDL